MNSTSNKRQVTFLDVGNSDSIILNIGGSSMLMDGGNDSSLSIVLSYMFLHRNCRFDIVVLTHPHKDHLFGLIPTIKKCSVTSLLFNQVPFESKLYEEFLQLVSDVQMSEKFQIGNVYKGDKIKISDITFHVLWPPKNFAEENINNHSVVLLLDYYDFEVLFLADLEYLFQENLLDDPFIKNIDLPLEVIKVPHQGSIDALNKQLIEYLQPQIAVFSVGKNNYGHPNPMVIAFYKQIGAKIMRTDELGTIVIDVPEMPSVQ